MKGKETNILYIGLHAETLLLLDKTPLRVIATSKLTYFYRLSINPFNLLFSFSYFLAEKKIHLLSTPCFYITYFVKKLLSPTYGKYINYLKHIIENRIEIIDVEADEELITQYIQQKNIDLILINYWSVLPLHILQSPTHGTINIHPSILPAYRGALPTLWSLKNKDTESAVTYLLIDSKVDGGNMIAQHKFNIEEQDNSLDIEEKINSIVRRTLQKDIAEFLNGKINPSTQTGTVSTTAKYHDYMHINWETEKAIDIVNKIILYPEGEPFVYCFTNYKNKIIEIKSASLMSDNTKNIDHLKAGEYAIVKLSLYIKAFDGIVLARLFKDISFLNSLKILLNKNKKFN
jgi:methionyl-tRNA formyltransferase